MKPLVHQPRMIAGAGGGKSGSSRGTGGGVEAPNSLKSKQVARVIDLLGEGPIVGLERGLQDVWLDGVPIQNSDYSYNFNTASFSAVYGYPAQDLLPGFTAQEAETSVGLQIKTTTPQTRTITNPNVDRARVTVSVPALQYTDKNSGNISGTSIYFGIYLQSNGGGFQYLGQQVISGKTNTRYQRAITFELYGAPPWDIRIVRETADSTVVELQNDLYWDSYTEIIDARVNYTLSACVGIVIDAEQFQSIPQRTYRPKGLYILIPNNYDPINRIYSGVWNGGFTYAWSNNPAWILYDLIINHRYGIGDFIGAAEVDKWALYSISQWCDGLVPNGRGGYEPRFVCDAYVTTQQEAFDLINSFSSIFRGFTYWSGGLLVPVADMPRDPVCLYTNANVIDGQFTYSGADIRARHNQVLASWQDPANLGEPRISIVEDQESISRFGIQKTDVNCIGCLSESQALRAGKWTLYTETYEGEIVTFKTGLDTAWARPGDVVAVADVTIGGDRRGGRVVASDGATVTMDAPTTIGPSAMLSCVLPSGAVQTRSAFGLTTDPQGRPIISVSPPFSAAPLPDSVWVLASSDLQPTLWRVQSIKEAGDDYTLEVAAVRYRPDKWAYVENNLPLSNPDVSNIALPAVTNLNASDYLVALSAISVGVRMLISWTSLAPHFDVAYRRVDGNWIRFRTDQTAADVEATDGAYQIQVTPLNSLGRRGPSASISYTVVGLSRPPDPPKNFRIQSVQGVAMFQWAPATELDVIIGGSFEMRYSPRVIGGTWSDANIVITSIPGSSTTVELPYRTGTYFLRTRDITGLYSTTWATIVTSGPDTAYRPFVRICEDPDWLGNKQNTIVQHPQEWLTIDKTLGGLWDDQTALMDTWAEVDNLPIGPSGPAPTEGFYNFFNRIDLGGVFAVRLVRDMLAFPIVGTGANFIDQRAGNVDDWQSWDDASDPGTGMVTTLVRQTNDDPSSPAAHWTEWTQFIAGEYTARAFEFRAWLTAAPGENVAIEELCILADISNKVDEGSDIAWVPSKMRINFKVKFYSIPSISIAIQEGIDNDNFRITNKTREYFDLELLNVTTIITGARTFDWIASGY